jgi:polysaccharide biosynthesis transport protein
MTDPVDTLLYIGYIRSRWRLVALSCCVALAVAAAISLVTPREFTATARIVIEPPAGADPRAAMAVSPIYLESLKTYEQFAAGDSLFQKSVERFQLRTVVGRQPIESLKKRVLKVGIVRNTRILEIAATLPDARKAQALAQYLAEETVSLNQALTGRSGEDLIAGIEKQAREARARLDRDDTEWTRLLADEPLDGLQAAISQAGDLRAKLREQAANARLELADAAEREKQASSAEAELLRKEQSNARARSAELDKQVDSLDRQIADQERALAQRQSRRDALEAQRKADQDAQAAIESRLREARNDLGYRGERLTIIDPGVVPERPSSPNIPLNLLAAGLLGLLFPLVYLALSLSIRQNRARAGQDVIEALSRARNA